MSSVSEDFIVESEGSSSESVSEPEPPKRKKGVRNDIHYRRNVIKNAKVAGEKHLNWKGNIVEKRKTGDSCNVTSSVAVVLNGNEPEFTDALGQKVPKPLPSLQVASPIDLLNPDRYEFFTFDDNGELIKRLMTIEEIQSIVANGDGEGPTIIHHGPVEDRDPEKNVQDIVNSVQNVLNKEVEFNKNSSTNILPVLDTPDVSSSWSMILPAIFGNTGGVDIFTAQRPQQIIMTPDTEIIETSTKVSKVSTTKKPKPNKRKPGQKRKPSVSASTTEETPQVIQEELDSHESVYTGMQQYHHLAATMQNYDGLSQLNMQPIYHKLPEPVQLDATTKRVFINNEELIHKPYDEDVSLKENIGKKPVTVQHKPLSPQRVKKPNGGQATTKRPQSTKQKTKRKPTTKKPETTSIAETSPSVSDQISVTTSSTIQPATSTTVKSIEITTLTDTAPIAATTVSVPKKKKKKPTRQPSKGSSSKPYSAAENSKPSQSTPLPQLLTSDLIAEGSAHQETKHNKYQHVTYHRPRPKPQKPTMSPISTTTVVISPIPVATVATPQDPTLIVEDFPGYIPANSAVWTKISTETSNLPTTTANGPTTTGTAGYPVPAYALNAQDSEDLNRNQYKTPVPIKTPIHDTNNKPDIHALQSFGQILQSLQIPEAAVDKTDHYDEISTKPSINPVKYDSAENIEQLEEIANKHKLPLINSAALRPTTNLSLNMHQASSTFSPVLSDMEATTDTSPGYSEESTTILQTTAQSIVATEMPEMVVTTFTSLRDSTMQVIPEEFSDITANTIKPNGNNFQDSSEQIEATTESSQEHKTPLLFEKPEEVTEISGEMNYSTFPEMIAQESSNDNLQQETTTVYNSGTTISPSGIPEEETNNFTNIQVKLPASSPHNKDTAFDDDRDNTNQPILVADLKPQLNMEILKPSEQISMSDFQTQAATVASTLVDGTNTLAVDYNILNSNETKDEIALLMSDVIKQISSNSGGLNNTEQVMNGRKPISSGSGESIYDTEHNDGAFNGYLDFKTVHTSLNDHRFSNFAKLNATFFATANSQNKLNEGNVEEIEHKPGMDGYKDMPLIDTVETHQESVVPSLLPIADPEEDSPIEATTELQRNVENEHIWNQNQSFSSEADNVTPISDAYDYFNSNEKTTTTIPKPLESQTKDYSIELNTLTDFTESSNVSSAPNLNESDYQFIAFKTPTPSLSEVYASQQSESQESENSNEREALFEADSNIIPTTEISSFTDESTYSEWQVNNYAIELTETPENEVTAATESTITMSPMRDADVQEPTTKSDYEDFETTALSFENLGYDNPSTSSTEVAPIKQESTGIDQNNNSNATQEAITLKDEEIQEVKIISTTDVALEHITEMTTQSNFNWISDIQENDTMSPKVDEEVTTIGAAQDMERTTSHFNVSEETSEELNAMISEEDETEELVNEDPYIKLGETTTKTVEAATASPLIKNNIKSEVADSESNSELEKISQHYSSQVLSGHLQENHDHMLDTKKPISTGIELIAAENDPFLHQEDLEQSFEGADLEDEEDQHDSQTPKLPVPFLTTTLISTTMTTTSKPTTTPTRRLNTLKPVSYFNKQSAYASFSDTVEPLYSKPINQGHSQQDSAPNKILTYVPTSQQRPMQRPPQLSNLMIASTQATRPPVKLEPSPANSKGLEASLSHLDQDILTFARLCNELAFSYWQSITSEKISSTRSLVLSPFALTSMLSMVFLGARGSTSGEMNDVLKLDDMVTFNPHLVFRNITDSVEKATDTDIATTAFVREIFSDRANGKILQFFKEKTQQFYSGHVEEVNFHVVNDIIRRRTNLLVKRHTMGKVLEYLRTNSVWVNGPLATISANLFQTDCSQGSTHERDGEIFFQVHPTVRQRRLVPIPAVLFKSGFTAGYEPNLEATVVAFGRIQDTTSMIYVMPGHHNSFSPSDNLDRLEKELMKTAISKNAWSNLLTSLMDRPGMEVQLPRFSHRSFVNASLGLQKMGLKGLFKSDFADLGGLTGSSNREVYLSDMIQINTFSTCGEEKIADHHHVEMYPAPPLRKRNKDVDAHEDDDSDSSEAIIDFGSLVQDSALGRGFYDDLLDPKYLELPLPLRPRQARVPDAPRLRLDKPFLYFVRHNPTGMILFMGRFNPRLLP